MSRPPLQTRASSSSHPHVSLPRMIISPFIRLLRRVAPAGLPSSLPSFPSISLPFSTQSSSASSIPSSSSASTSIPIVLAFVAALQRLDLSRDPRKTLAKLSRQNLTVRSILPHAFFLLIALYCLYIMRVPLLLKFFIPSAYILAILLPITSQLIWPATPVLAWVILFFTARFIPSNHRPTIHVALLPALESVLYGANISDLQTRYTNPIMDIVAWLPYGVAHFSVPVVVALVLWALGPKKAPQYWGKAFGWMNLVGVLTQILFPCAAPCELGSDCPCEGQRADDVLCVPLILIVPPYPSLTPSLTFFDSLFRASLRYFPLELAALDCAHRVRNHTRPHPRRLLYARLSRWSPPDRSRTPHIGIYQRLRRSPPCIRRVPLPAFRVRSNGGALPLSFLPGVQTFLLVLCRPAVVGDNVSVTSLSHRFDRWSMFERGGILHYYAGDVQGYRSDRLVERRRRKEGGTNVQGDYGCTEWGWIDRVRHESRTA